MNSTQVFEKRKIAVAIGIDLAKDHCDVVAYNADNKGSSSKPPSLNDGGADLFKRVTFDQVLKSVESSRER